MQCTECTKLYHLECLSIPSNEDDPTTSTWLCPQCHGTQKLGNNDNTLVRYNPNITVRPGKRQVLNSPLKASDERPITRDEMQEIIKDVVTQFQKTMRITISDILGTELKSLKEEIVDMKKSMNFIYTKYESITKEHAEANDKIKLLETENGALQSKVEDFLEQTAPYLSKDQILKSMKSLDLNKGPGPDCVPPLFIKACVDELVTPIYLIFKKSLKSGLFPDVWKSGKVVPIHKADNVEVVEDIEQFQCDVDRMVNWCRDNGMYLNTNKCYRMKFSRKIKSLNTSYKINGDIIKKTEEVRDLGIVFDKKLTFVPHIEHTLTTRAYRML
ncbi:unnamed protein product [Parnassius apollo]|uniref:(apollo) hypothetical protein n=1 Tax=Parnassius apollo TaxID=110799 RepID=A0A8S3WJI6_PARAO|nr:unnamed protein product [Parnassius apollo]